MGRSEAVHAGVVQKPRRRELAVTYLERFKLRRYPHCKTVRTSWFPLDEFKAPFPRESFRDPRFPFGNFRGPKFPFSSSAIDGLCGVYWR